MKNTNMASTFALFCTFFLIFLATMNKPVQASKEFKVGDTEGWRQPGINDTAMYNEWAAKNRFVVGDSLRFQYTNDSVLVVDKWGYYHCNTSDPISTFNDGNSVVNLDKPGPMYFITGDSNHCKDGQRLVIEVMTLHPISPPSIAGPPGEHSSSGASVSVTLVSVSMALIIATFVLFAP